LSWRDVVGWASGRTYLAAQLSKRIIGSESRAVEIDDSDSGGWALLWIDIFDNRLFVVLEPTLERNPSSAISIHFEVDIAKVVISSLSRW
jgi:hypothetical protein